MNQYGEESGWENVGDVSSSGKAKRYACKSATHEPPENLVVPVGKIYRHVCDDCSYVVRVNSDGVKL